MAVLSNLHPRPHVLRKLILSGLLEFAKFLRLLKKTEVKDKITVYLHR